MTEQTFQAFPSDHILVTFLGLIILNCLLHKRHEFEVEMTCEGCSGAVTRVLNKKGKYPWATFHILG